MNIRNIIKDNELQSLFTEGNFGIEKEGLRTDPSDQLAMTDHPHVLGSRLYHPYLFTDFSEAQPEIVTPVQPSLKLTFNWLEALHDVLHRSMNPDEYLWPNSMPNLLPDEEDIPIVRYNDPDAISYRQHLADSYGKKKQTISGIHFNFSFSEDFIEAIFQNQTTHQTKTELQNELYTKLSGNFLKYEWLLLYLFGASPYADSGFYDSKSGRLLKSLQIMYVVYEIVLLVTTIMMKSLWIYDSAESYVRILRTFVETGHLSEEREFYEMHVSEEKGILYEKCLNQVFSMLNFVHLI